MQEKSIWIIIDGKNANGYNLSLQLFDDCQQNPENKQIFNLLISCTGNANCVQRSMFKDVHQSISYHGKNLEVDTSLLAATKNINVKY